MQCEYTNKVSSLMDGEQGRSEAEETRRHIARCAECQKAEEAFLALRQRIKSYGYYADSVAQRRALTSILASTNARKRQPLVRNLSLATVSIALLILCGVGAYLWRASAPDAGRQAGRQQIQSWTVERLAGSPKVASNNIEESGRWTTGEWLETDATSRARVDVANIGSVEVDPNSRLRLVETNSNEHRLALAKGKIQASISAPPRLFFVDTPSAVAVDYGCAYTLEVDERGRSFLHVTAGWVALEAQGRESFVPAGATCTSEPGKAPGTPYFSDAGNKFRRALTEFDFGNNELPRRTALDTVLNEARKRDGLTLWHLLARVNDAERERVYKRLGRLVPPPAGVTREGVLNLDKEMLRLWKVELEQAWDEDAT